MRFPASRGSFRIRYSPFDVVWAAWSPPIALYLRAVDIGNPTGLQAAELFCVVAFATSLVAFLMFNVRDGIAHHFSVHDALEVAKAVVVSDLFTTLALFTAVRLDGIPRSTPIIHALILTAGMIMYRIVIRMRHEDPPHAVDPEQSATEHIVMIGSTRLSSLYIRMMKAYSPQKHKVVAILDGNPRNIGSAVDGIHVVGPPEQLESIIQEFAEHGIAVNRVLVGGDRELLAPEEADVIDRACASLNVALEYVPLVAGLGTSRAAIVDRAQALQTTPAINLQLPLYFRFKRVADIVAGLVALVLLLPVILVVACLVLLDVGSPILFWQQRIGAGGRSFLLHKFRTLKPLFNERGLPIGTSSRMSWAGAFIRKTRLDELPQLLNVLVGDMSLVGPRPLLPQDQPLDPSIRLLVKPGLTGWAQINGGKSLTAEKKSEFDEWYVRNASLSLDLRILLLTFRFIFTGERPAADPAIDCRETADSKL